MTNDNDDDYRVGYCKPPKHSRFPKGKSGYKQGRRKGSKNADTVIRDEMNKRITIIENGKRKTVTRFEALIKMTIKEALEGNAKSRQMLFQLHKENGGLNVPQNSEPVVITMTLPPALPGEDRSYRDGPPKKKVKD